MGSFSGGSIGEVASRLQAIAATNIGAVAGSHASGSLSARFESIAGEVDELVGIARTRSAEIESEIGALREKVRGLSGTEDALDGTLLIKQDNQTIAALKHRNNYWREGLLGFEGADGEKIESHLRSRPVAAAAAAVLGHPIVLARVPSAEGVRSFDVIPTRVLSPPEGYLDRDVAKQAAVNLLAENRGTTGIITYDGLSTPERWHVLAADFDSSPRTVAREKKKMFGRTNTRTSVEEVRLEHTTDDVRIVVTTNNNAKASVIRAAWPEGRTTPINAEELNQLGMTHAYKSELAVTNGKIIDLEAEAQTIRYAIGNIKPLREQLIAQKRLLGELAVVPDKPGKFGPATWEGTQLGILTDSTSIGMGFDEAAMATHIALPGVTPSDAALKASAMKSDKLLFVMQDAEGTSHIVFSDRHAGLYDNFASETWTGDVRAVVNPVNRTIHSGVNGHSNEPITTAAKSFDQNETTLHDWLRNSIIGKPEVSVEGQNFGRFTKWSEEEPGRVLYGTNINDAIDEAMRYLELEPSPGQRYIVSGPKKGHTSQFALIRGEGPPYDSTSYMHESVVAIMHEGQVFRRR